MQSICSLWDVFFFIAFLSYEEGKMGRCQVQAVGALLLTVGGLVEWFMPSALAVKVAACARQK